MLRIIHLASAIAVWFGCCLNCYAQLPTPIHAYELNGSLADTFGGPAIVNNGATLGATGLTFAPNQGPSLSNWLGGTATAGNYSIEMYFSITNTDSYRKLVDFADRSSDNGLYNLFTALDFYPVGGGSNGAIPANTMTHLVLTRDGASNAVVGYINGSTALGFSFTDSTGLATFTGANNIIQFLRDDLVTSGNEASAGFVDFIRVYDHPLTAQDAANLFAAVGVPEPGVIALTAGGIGLMLVGIKRRRQRRRAKHFSLEC